MSATYIRLAAPLILSLMTACATKIAQPTTTARAATASPTGMVYVTGSRLGVPTSSGATQGAQPVQSVGQQQIQQSGQTNLSDALRILVPAQQTSSGGINAGQ
jgi:hypothetical protein